MKNKIFIILMGIILISLVSANAPVVENVFNNPASPEIDDGVEICAEVAGEVETIRLYLEWEANNANLFLYGQEGEYCRGFEEDYFEPEVGDEVSYYIFVENDFGSYTTKWYDFVFQEDSAFEPLPDPEPPQPPTPPISPSSRHSSSGTTNIDFSQFCEPNWKCRAWGSCDNGVKTRSCYDSNYCEYAYGKPPEMDFCKSDLVGVIEKESSVVALFVVNIVVALILLVVLIGLLRR